VNQKLTNKIPKVSMQRWQEFEDAPVALLSFNSAFELIWVNKAAFEIEPRLVKGVDVRLVFSSFKTEFALEWFKTGLGKFAANAETSSGERVLLQAWLPLNGDTSYFCSITREPARSVLEERRELLAEATDQAWESICITDAELDLPGPRFLYVNRGYEDLFGFTEAEVLGKTPRMHQGPLTDKSVLHRLKSELKEGKTFHGEAINYRKSGKPFWLEWKICPIKNEFGTVTRFISFQRDISALKEARQRLDDFHSTLSHELRAPLASVLGSLKLMRSFHPPTSEKGGKLLDIALLCSDRLARLLNDLLDLSKLEAGKMELKKTLVQVPDLISDSAASLETYQVEKKVRISTDSVDTEVFVDRDRIIQVLTNLLSNAIKFSPEDGTVFMSARRTTRHTIRFAVRDEGPGISEENQVKLFQKFQQLQAEDGTTRAGTGLGLVVAKALIGEHGSDIEVESEIGQGTEFSFEVYEAQSPNILETSGNEFKPPTKE
jgi:PAS domain S-box-containing protein